VSWILLRNSGCVVRFSPRVARFPTRVVRFQPRVVGFRPSVVTFPLCVVRFSSSVLLSGAFRGRQHRRVSPAEMFLDRFWQNEPTGRAWRRRDKLPLAGGAVMRTAKLDDPLASSWQEGWSFRGKRPAHVPQDRSLIRDEVHGETGAAQRDRGGAQELLAPGASPCGRAGPERSISSRDTWRKPKTMSAEYKERTYES
jgi:hypothetical protein